MYLPAVHEVRDVGVMHALIAAHPLGAWVTVDDSGSPTADHLPFLLDADRGEHGTLLGHVARANPAWRAGCAGRESLVVFQSADTYISPSWYPSKHAHGKAVPTWNYAVVHAHGVARAIDDAAWLRAFLDRLTARHEAGQALPWRIDDAPADYVDRMIGAVVGIEIPIARLIGKWKVSQNRPAADRLGVVAGLSAQEGADAARMAALVGAHAPGDP